MLDAGLPPVAVDTFRHYWELLQDGTTGLVPETEIEPVASLPSLADLGDHAAAGRAALAATVVVKLNGGLGTSMGMTRAKSLLPVKGDRCFLDIVAEQVLARRSEAGVRLPLVLMNSFRTRDGSLAQLARHRGLGADLPADFLQHKVPRIRVSDGAAIEWPDDPDAEWCPPGHGDLYTALVTSGMLDRMLEGGYRYAFVSNADNLGAVLDPNLLGWFADEGAPFLMEVAERTEADRKGGHLARRPDGGLLLRESAQCPAADQAAFQDLTRHRYFNTNSVWLDLVALDRVLEEREHVLGLPMIRNEKHVVPGDDATPRVHQLETAMGAAIAVFEGATAVCVPRSRFAPVKTTDDLLVVRSDAYALSPDAEMVSAVALEDLPVVDLDKQWFGLVQDFDARFPHGPPSLRACRHLRVRGDVHFGRGVVVEGDVEVAAKGDARHDVPDGAVLRG
ncbi:MAG: UTP--glucose-1-phosphate uridylyltransferase [Deltaproteobacteria bacterium]|nr:UTP--glucose-1-phosphate uridylyltransferase [Deltaproteobacteria bacterium]MBW2447692.1 UTP--glucose-1-phosphate uridylyltransferase [Deltaproteobacteria bacterium]